MLGGRFSLVALEVRHANGQSRLQVHLEAARVLLSILRSSNLVSIAFDSHLLLPQPSIPSFVWAQVLTIVLGSFPSFLPCTLVCTSTILPFLRISLSIPIPSRFLPRFISSSSLSYAVRARCASTAPLPTSSNARRSLPTGRSLSSLPPTRHNCAFLSPLSPTRHNCAFLSPLSPTRHNCAFLSSLPSRGHNGVFRMGSQPCGIWRESTKHRATCAASRAFERHARAHHDANGVRRDLQKLRKASRNPYLATRAHQPRGGAARACGRRRSASHRTKVRQTTWTKHVDDHATRTKRRQEASETGGRCGDAREKHVPSMDGTSRPSPALGTNPTIPTWLRLAAAHPHGRHGTVERNRNGSVDAIW